MTNSNTSDVFEKPPHIKQELVSLCDSYKAFHHFCAFYCKASSTLVRSYSVDLDEDYAEGMARFAQMVTEQSQEIDLQLKQLLRKM